jgi:hypothetical protein
MIGLTINQRAVALTVILFTGFCVLIAIAGDYTAEYKCNEGMVFGFNATSDDMLNYTDRADADITNSIKWKVRGCSTISQADLDAAVANAKRAQQIEDSGTCEKRYYS